MRQRVMIAIVSAMRPGALDADEGPRRGRSRSRRRLELLVALQRDVGMAVALITMTGVIAGRPTG